jgi:signal peptide peptidase SppA
MTTMKDETSKYRHIVRAVAETPWAILPSTLATIVDLVQFRAEGGQLSQDEIQERIGAGPARRGGYTAGAVGVLPLYGVIMPRATLMSEISGGTSLQSFCTGLRELLANDQVGSLLIDVNSPGGSTDLIAETAAEIRAARGSKPIVAIANTTAASAAYWLASQADELVVTPSGSVGSIGVFGVHEDWSKFEESLGVKTTLISAGKYKTELNPHEPLTAEARQAAQGRVDEFYAMFVADVAKGRGASPDDVRGGFGEGRMVLAKSAVKAGMADRVATFDDTVTRLARGGGTSRRTSAEGSEELLAGDLAAEETQIPSTTEDETSSSLVPGAERLLSRRSFRDAIAQ